MPSKPGTGTGTDAASTKNKKTNKKKQSELLKIKREQNDIENKRIHQLIQERWSDSLLCLNSSIPLLRANPWLIIHNSMFIHNYLDSLTEVLSHLSTHPDQLDHVRATLQNVYEGFVDIGKFTKYQPNFYLTNSQTIKRFIRLLEQVAHRGSDRALLPNVLSMLGPTFERDELYDLLAQHNITHSLLSFARNEWLPTPSTLSLLLAIIEQLSLSETLRYMFIQDSGWIKLIHLTYGIVPGFTRDQQMSAQQSLACFSDEHTTGLANGGNANNTQLTEAQQLLASMNLNVNLALDAKPINIEDTNTVESVAG